MASFSSKNFSSGKLRKSSIDLGEKAKKIQDYNLLGDAKSSQRQTQYANAKTKHCFTRGSIYSEINAMMRQSCKKWNHFFKQCHIFLITTSVRSFVVGNKISEVKLFPVQTRSAN